MALVGMQLETLPDGSIKIRRNIRNGVAESEEIIPPNGDSFAAVRAALGIKINTPEDQTKQKKKELRKKDKELRKKDKEERKEQRKKDKEKRKKEREKEVEKAQIEKEMSAEVIHTNQGGRIILGDHVEIYTFHIGGVGYASMEDYVMKTGDHTVGGLFPNGLPN